MDWEKDVSSFSGQCISLRIHTECSVRNFFCFPGSRRNTCTSQWSCCEENCYYFSHEFKNFEDSKKFCKKLDSTLLKIEDKKELVMYILLLSHTTFVSSLLFNSFCLMAFEYFSIIYSFKLIQIQKLKKVINDILILVTN
jgi:hypothetical protein